MMSQVVEVFGLLSDGFQPGQHCAVEDRPWKLHVVEGRRKQSWGQNWAVLRQS